MAVEWRFQDRPVVHRRGRNHLDCNESGAPEVIFGISPDHRELLVANGGGTRLGEADVWVQPLPAGTAHRVGNISASGAAWAPDGQHILYASGAAIKLTNNEGTEPPRVLAKVPGDARAFRFSPDGRRVRFWVTEPKGESNSIWEMDADGKNLHPLFPNWKQSSYQCCGNWSPTGEYYYFQAYADNEEGIWVMPERFSILSRAPAGPSRLTTGALRFTTPLPSDDGKKLFVIGSEPRVELSRYDVHARRFDPYFSGLSAGPVDFSPDGKWIAYVSYPDMTLWRSRMDGTEKQQLTFPPVRVYEPRWSPDGSKIAFMDVRFNSRWKISLLSSSGGTPELLVQDSTDEADPTWTPDGESILFGKFDGTDKGTIYRLDLKSRKIFPIPDSKGMFSPRLSRDGRYISAFTENASKLMLFETATQRWSRLMQGEELSYNEWSHDGKYVYLRQDEGGAGELVRVRIKDHLVEHILSFKDFPQLADPFTGWIGLTPDDAPLLMRDRSVQEFYALDLAFH
jgi:Tol biopolymer transport system component